tara:strand:+ start:4462 stop:5016 length:555 start_codon:yes stop_codon:yes gene_type:complete
MVEWKKGILSTAIAIVLTIFIIQAESIILNEPEYNQFCEREQFPRPIAEKLITDESTCRDTFIANADIENECIDNKGQVLYKTNEKGCQEATECSTCNIDYETARDNFERTAFFISLIVGIIAIVAGVLIKTNAIGTGLMGGGLLLIVIGTMSYWSGLQQYARLIILGIVLAILIFIGHKKFSK